MEVKRKLSLQIEKSFEGEFRIRLLAEEIEIISMPWVVGEDLAIRQFGTVLQKYNCDIAHALENEIPIRLEAIRRVIQ